MKVTLCGSVHFAKEMQETKRVLAAMGHEVLLPDELQGEGIPILDEHDAVRRKIEFDLIRRHWGKIQQSDAILVLNYDKGDVRNYIGGNSFLEMGFAHVLRKKVYVLHDIPDVPYRVEILAMSPVVLHGDLRRLGR